MEYNAENIARFVATLLEDCYSWRVTPIDDTSFELEIGEEAHDVITWYDKFVVEFDSKKITYDRGRKRTFYRCDFELWAKDPRHLMWWNY